ncbi:MAG: TlyA family RNA methyltransferase, partial [Clostridia bacterium]|nr:TlyA family RNA methyltransferase [Clostridia bacterium]
MRLDVFLTNRGDFDSRNKAAAAIKDHWYAVNGKTVSKPSFDITDEDEITALKETSVYVARSAHKLLNANRQFNLNWGGKTVADFGA